MHQTVYSESLISHKKRGIVPKSSGAIFLRETNEKRLDFGVL